MNAPITSDLLRKCQERGECPTTTAVCAVLGEAVDAGIVSLPDLLDLARSCSTADELGDALVMLATTAQLQPEGVPAWTR